MAEEAIMTDNDLAMANIFGKKVETPEVPATPETPAEPEITPEVPAEPPVEPVSQEDIQEAPPADTPPAEPVPIDYEGMPEEKLLELFNKKFNVNFDSMDDASQLMGSQLEYRRQDDIIKKLVDRQKDTNVLSYFGSENSYKVNQLAKEYPGKENTLTKVIGSDVSNLTDFEVIELAERMAKPAGTKVDVLGVKLRTMGITDGIADFDDWEVMDQQVVIGAAEDARETLKQLQSKIAIPKEGEDGAVDTFVSDIESGFQAADNKQKEQIEVNTPIAESMVNSLIKIKPVEGSEFEFDINQSVEAKKDLLDYLLAESVDGNYDIKSDSDVKRLQGMLEQEIWATDGAKMAKAYGKFVEDKTWAEANIKFGNDTPLDNPVPPSDPNAPTPETDDDRARKLLGR